MEAIPDVPEEIDIQLERTEFITSKLIEKHSETAQADDSRVHTEPVIIEQYPDFGGVYKHEVHEDMPDSAQMYRWRPI